MTTMIKHHVVTFKLFIYTVIFIILNVSIINAVTYTLTSWTWGILNNSIVTPFNINSMSNSFTTSIVIQLATENMNITNLKTGVSNTVTLYGGTYTTPLPMAYNGNQNDYIVESITKTNTVSNNAYSYRYARWPEASLSSSSYSKMNWIPEEESMSRFGSNLCIRQIIFEIDPSYDPLYNYYLVGGQRVKSTLLQDNPNVFGVYGYNAASKMMLNIYGYNNNDHTPPVACTTPQNTTADVFYGVSTQYYPHLFIHFESQIPTCDFVSNTVSEYKIMDSTYLVDPKSRRSPGTTKVNYFTLKKETRSSLVTLYSNAYWNTYGTKVPFNVSSSVSLVSASLQLIHIGSFPLISSTSYQHTPVAPLGYLVRAKLTFSSINNLDRLDFNCSTELAYSDRDIYSINYNKVIPIPTTSQIMCTMSIYAFYTNGDYQLLYTNPSPFYLAQGGSSQPGVTSLYSTTYNSIFSPFARVQIHPLFTPVTHIVGAQVSQSNLLQDLVVIKSHFPFGFNYTAKDCYFFQTIYNPLDIPTIQFNYTYFEYNYPQYASSSSPVAVQLDLLNPLVNVSLNFNNENNGTIITSVKDSILGIGADSCKLSYGPYDYVMDPPSRIRGDHYDATYFHNFKYNPVYCSFPWQVNCSDIRGNRLEADSQSPFAAYTFTSSNQDTYCNPILQNGMAYVLHTSFYFLDNNVTGFIVQLDVLPKTSVPNVVEYVELNLYSNFDNTRYLTTIPLTLSSYSNATMLFETQVSLQTLVTRLTTAYMSLGVKLKTQSTPFNFTTRDIEFFTGRNQYMAQSSYSVVIRPINYNPLPDFQLLSDNDSNPTVFTVAVPATTTPVTRVTLKIKNFYSPRVFSRTSPIPIFPPPSPAARNITFPVATVFPGSLLQYGYYAWIDSACTVYECQQYTATGYFISFEATATPPFVNDLFPENFTISQNNVDPSSNNRQIQMNASMANPLDPVYLPTFYLTEKYSNDKINCSAQLLTPNVAPVTFGCTITIPPNWGLRGFEASVWGIVHGAVPTKITGGVYNGNVGVSSTTRAPAIWNSVHIYGTPHITVRGTQLGWIGNNPHNPTLKTVSLPTTIIDASTVYLTLPNGVDPFNPFNFTMDSIDYYVDVIGCTYPQCNNHGKCNFNTMVCDCDAGWSGIGCGILTSRGCPSGCGNGTCTGNVCSCALGYNGDRCQYRTRLLNSLMRVEAVDPTSTFYGYRAVNETQDILSDASKQTNFTVKIIAIKEKDISDEIVSNFDLSDWHISIQSASVVPSQISAMVNEVNNHTSSDVGPDYDAMRYIFNKILSNGANVTVTVDVYIHGGNVTWANENITIPELSFKYTTRIEGYPFKSKLNTLQVVYNTESVSPPGPCDDEKPSDPNDPQYVSFGGSSKKDAHWYMMHEHQLSLYSTFTNNIIVDGEVVLNFNEVDPINPNLIQLTVTSPYFKTYVEMDPEFSTLVDYKREDVDNCGNKKKTIPYLIAIIIVCAIVGAALLVGGAILLVKKSTFIRYKLLKFRSTGPVKLSKI